MGNHFDGTTAIVVVFLVTVQGRALSFGWIPILMILDNDRINHNHITDYGCLTMTKVATHAATYVGHHS